MKKNFKMKAFTLAEVLVTLTIIGIVATITIPSLVRRHQDKVTVTKVLKMYSTLTDAYGRVYAANGPTANWLADSGNYRGTNPALLFDEIKTTKRCNTISEGCFYGEGMISLDGYVDWIGYGRNGGPSAVLPDGGALDYGGYTVNCSNSSYGEKEVCGVISYDIDGPDKGENKRGIDIFNYILTNNGISVGGEPGKNEIYCKLSRSHVHNGRGCTKWIVENRNLKYLHDKNVGY